VFVLLKSYLDGGNQADSTRYDVLSLASVTGEPDQWRAFEADWASNLAAHHAHWLHTTDALALKDPFTEAKGWNKVKVDAFISDCVGVIERHLIIPNFDNPKKPASPGLFPHVVSVALSDFVKARNVNPDVPNTAEEVCAVQSIFLVLERGRALGTHFYRLIFDPR